MEESLALSTYLRLPSLTFTTFFPPLLARASPEVTLSLPFSAIRGISGQGERLSGWLKAAALRCQE